ncbi:glycoside hydrolase domain-containing protein [Phyllobacterium sp. SYP-B3895]|uniref:glycoside hydrolase domain-containing protein n=1 Tax=Phyllobacterium sp. SYP-B3895 TaxID=2663240 RepID=UPI00351A705B
MLAGCNSDDKKDADAAATSTFASDVDALKQDNTKLNAKVGELQAAAAGTATVSVTVVFGAKNFDLVSAAKFFKQEAFNPDSACNNKGSYSSPQGMQHYLTYGYMTGNANITLETVTQDRSAAAFLKALPAPVLTESGATAADISALLVRANNWTNNFDDTSKMLKTRNAGSTDAAGALIKGTFINGTSFHESTEPNYFWSYAQSWTDIINRLGADRTAAKLAAMNRLNTLFGLNMDLSGPEPSSKTLNSSEGGSTFYVGNEMNFSTPWAYNWAGSPKHTQYVLSTILNKNFTNDPGGLPGNDDLGSLSTFYVFAALGIYPVVPSEPGFAISAPQFDGINFWLPNGKKLRFSTGGKSALLDDVRFIQDMKLNAATYQGTWLPLDKIKDGGQLTYTLSKTPTGWGEGEALTPPSGPAGDYSKPTANPLPSVQMIQ